MDVFYKIYSTVNNKLVFYFSILLLMMIVGAIFEMAGITLVVPVILSLLDANSFQFDGYLDYFLNLFGFRDREILSLVFLVLLFYVIKNLFLFILIIASNWFLYVIYYHISKKIFNNYLNQSYKNMVKQNLALLIRNVTGETFAYQNVIAQLLFLLTELFVVIGIFILIFYFEPNATAITIIFIFFLSLIFYYLSKKYYKRWGEGRVHFSGLSNKAVVESLKAFKEIKIYKKTEYFFLKFKQNIKMHGKMHMYISIFASAPRSWLETFGIFLIFIIVYYNISSGYNSEDISETLILFSFCAIRILPSINRIITHFTYFRHFNATVDLMYDELYKNQNNYNNEGNKKLTKIKDFSKSIILKDICFDYKNKDKFNLTNINLKIDSNLFFGIVGKSGSGKSTLIDLILGLLTPNSGDLIIDDNKISKGYEVDGNWISYVPQNVYLMDDSIKKNIALGVDDKNIDLFNLEKCIENSGLKEFILSLNKGIETEVGDSGIRLSGGQIQRIGIARALYNNPKLLILDESTSALDISTENEILESINKLKGKITLIIISHRPNTLKVCDKIYNIDKGILS